MNAVAYLRVSGQSQVVGTGFDRQHLACHTYASLHRLELAEMFREEAVSGTADEDSRPAFQAMIAYMLDGGIKTVIIERLDRLARMLDLQMQLVLYVASKGLTLISADTGEDITAAVMGDPMRKAMVQMQGVFAELDKSMIVAKLRKGRERTKLKNGRCEGQKPFGHYGREAETLRTITLFSLQKITCRDIAERLNQQGYKTRSGRPWSPAVVAKILRRELLTQKSA